MKLILSQKIQTLLTYGTATLIACMLIVSFAFALPAQTNAQAQPADPYAPPADFQARDTVTAVQPAAPTPGQSDTLAGRLYEGAKRFVSSLTPEGIARTILEYVNAAVLTVISFAVSFTGILLNSVLYYTVVNMKDIVDKLQVIDDVWKVVRDFLNMFFIFGLIYAAVTHIIGQGGPDLKRTILHIVVGAVFMNFSLVMTKTLIDLSNVLTIGLYEQLPGVQITNINAPGLSNAIMQSVKLQSVFAPGNNVEHGIIEKGFATALGDLAMFIISSLMGSLLMLIVAFLFIAASVLFIVRFIVLIFLMALSPLAFAGWALPFDEVKQQSNKWWGQLRKHLTFPVVYMLLMWVSFKIMIDGHLSGAIGADGYRIVDSFKDLTAQTVSVILNYAIVMGFMFYSLITAAESGVPGAKAMSAWGQKQLKGLGKGIGQNTASYIGRNTVGRAAQAVSTSNALNKVAGSLSPELAKSLRGSIGAAANATYGLGGGRSYTGALKDRNDAVLSEIEAQGKAQPLTQGFNESDDAFKKRTKIAGEEARARAKDYRAGILRTQESGVPRPTPSTTPILGSTRLRSVVNTANNLVTRGIPRAAQVITGSVNEDVSLRGAMKGKEKEADKETKHAKLKEAAENANAADITKAIKAMNDEQLREFDFGGIINPAGKSLLVSPACFPSGRFLSFMNSSSVSSEKKDEVSTLRYAEVTRAGSPADVRAATADMSYGEIAQMDQAILLSTHVIRTLGPRVLEEMMKIPSLPRIIRERIRNHVVPAAYLPGHTQEESDSEQWMALDPVGLKF